MIKTKLGTPIPQTDEVFLYTTNLHISNHDSLSRQKKKMSLKEIFALFAVYFSYALCFSTLNNIIIPKYIARMAASKQSVWISIVTTLGAAFQFVTPIVGAYSDRLGSRSIFFKYGAFFTAFGLFIFLILDSLDSLFLLCLAHIITTTGLSMVYGMSAALLNDHVIEDQLGRASGSMAVLALFGSGSGCFLFLIDVPVKVSLSLYISTLILSVMITIYSIPVKEKRREASSVSISEILSNALTLPSIDLYPDFAFACIGRAMFNCGIAGQIFLLFYLRDVIKTDKPIQITSAIYLVSLLGGLLAAIPSGIYSDKVGKKPVIYFSVCLCALSLLLFLFLRNVSAILVVGFLYGVGNSAYLTVDYALGAAALPQKEGQPVDAARDLGLFSMSATLGTLFGQIVYGGALDFFGSVKTADDWSYDVFGYNVIFSLASLSFLLSALATVSISIK